MSCIKPTFSHDRTGHLT